MLDDIPKDGGDKPQNLAKAPEVVNCDAFQFPHPFHDYDRFDATYSDESHAEDPMVLAELRMLELSWAIRSKKGWQEKMRNPEIFKHWEEEAVAAQQDLFIERKLSANMLNYVFTELDAHARLTDPGTGIQFACNDKTFFSCNLISEQLLSDLRQGVAILENIPEDKKDWHPGSNNLVLDLVHPSLYCLVNNQTYIRSSISQAEFQDRDRGYYSMDFAWIPSDFSVDQDGEVRLTSPYINNLHKSNETLYSAVPKILGRFIPMFSRVLGAIGVRPGDKRVPDERDKWRRPRRNTISHRINPGDPRIDRYMDLEGIGCLWGMRDIPYEEQGEENGYEGYPGATYEERIDAFYRMHKLTLPETPEEYAGSLEENFRVVDLRGRTLQCIVKLANIHLTPENPEYPGGNWHVEGMLNERIVSTGIYYYDSENITGSTLSFRASVHAPGYHQQDDNFCMRTLYGIDKDDALIQDRGVVSTTSGLALAFPNIYQHRVSSFQLVDPTKPGHRKILAFFLVDPHERIPSTTDIAPQQTEWMHDFMGDASTTNGIGGTRLAGLPVELRRMIVEMTDGLMTWEEACKFREGLMKERSHFVKSYEEETSSYARFNLCEH